MKTVTIDSKGRLILPREARRELRLDPGAVVALRWDDGALHVRRVEDPFEGLAAHALAEHEAGRTRDLRDVARDMGVDLDTP